MKKAEKMVMAYGSNGLEPTPESETVSIPVCPVAIDMDNGTPVTPDLYRFFKRGNEGTPTSLRNIQGPGTRKPNYRPYVYVEFSCTRFVRYTLDDITHYGDSSGCYVRHMRDALDPLWSALSDGERAQIIQAVQETSHE